jgi:hypothetical protein
VSVTYAAPDLRDRFLRSLAAPIDNALVIRLARDLIDSANPLPRMTCEELGIPCDSTYGAAARHVLERYAPDAVYGGA